MKGVMCGERFEEAFLVEVLPVESEVASGKTLVVDLVVVSGRNCDGFEAGGFVNDGAIQYGVVQGGLGQACFCVFNGEASGVSLADC